MGLRVGLRPAPYGAGLDKIIVLCYDDNIRIEKVGIEKGGI